MSDVCEFNVATIKLPNDNVRNICAEIILPDARYHFWFDGTTMTMNQPILYKNPHLGIKMRDPGYFDTRKLNPESARNAKLIAEMMRQITEKGLVQQAIEEVVRRKGNEQRAWLVRNIVAQYWANQMDSAECPTNLSDISSEEFRAATNVLASRFRLVT